MREQFRDIASQVPGLIYQFILRPDGSHCAPYLSDATRKIYRVTPEEAMADASIILKLIHPDDHAAFWASVEVSARDLTPWHNEHRVKFSDGTVRWLLGNSLPQRLADGSTLWNGFITDITEQKQAEAYAGMGREILKILAEPGEMKASLMRIIATLKAGTGFEAVGIRMQNGEDFPYAAQEGFSEDFLRTENTLIAHGPDGKICRDKDGCAKLECTCGLVITGLGGKKSPLFTPAGSFWTNDSPAHLVIPAEEDPRFHPRNTCINFGYASIALVPIRDGERSIGLIQFNDSRKGCFTPNIIKLMEDISMGIGTALMHKQAEAALKQSHLLLAGIINSLTVRVFWKDRDLKYLGCNTAFAADAGFTGENDVIGKDDFGMGWSKQAELYRADDRAVIDSGQAKILIEEPQTTPTGKIITLLTNKIPLRDTEGRIIGVLGTYVDITEHKAAQASQEEKQKLESLGTLAGGIAHDFNNILTAILGNISLLKPRIAGDGEAAEILTEAQEACATAKGLSNQLLTFAKGESPIIAAMDLRPVLTQAASFAARGLSTRCVFDLGDSPLIVNIDKDQISRVIQNLVINASQAMPQGGDIAMRAEVIALEMNLNPHRTAGRYVRLTVSDQGDGIKPEHLRKIFEPYFSTKGMGRGLGLAMSYSIMAKHGGNISAEMRPETGAVFVLHLPLADAAAVPAVKERPAPHAGSGKVLVMDDEIALAKVLKRIIEHLGYQAEVVTDGQAALDAYALAMKEGKPYDVVILDLTVAGGMGGKEAIVKLKALDPRAKAIVSSGYANNPVMVGYAAYGFSGVLVKPYTIEQISEALRLVLGSN